LKNTILVVQGQNGSGKMVRTKWFTDKILADNMVWTRCYGQNGTD